MNNCSREGESEDIGRVMSDKELQKAKVFFIYLDRTTDVNPKRVGEVFYVGKGKIQRVKDEKPRNKLWGRIAKKYGFVREVIFATKDEQVAFEMEKQLIAEHKTFAGMWKDGSGWGGNLTCGGEGSSGLIISEDTRKKLSIAHSGPNNHNYGKKGILSPFYGKNLSENQKQKIADAQSGEKSIHTTLTWKEVDEIRAKYLTGNYTKPELGSEYHLTSTGIGQIIHNRTWKSPDYEKTYEAKYQEPINKEEDKIKFAKNKLTIEDVISIRNKYASGEYFIKELAKEYDVDKANIRNIVNRKIWKHIEITEAEKAPKPIKSRTGQKGEASTNAKLTWEKVAEIRLKYSTNQYSQLYLAKEYGVSEMTIHNILKNKVWKEKSC